MCAQTNQLPSTILLPKHDEPRSIWSTTWFYQRRKPSPTCDKHLPMLGHTTDLTVQDSVPALARTTSSQAPGQQCPPCAASREKKANPERFLAPPGKLQPLQCFLLPLCPSAPLSKIRGLLSHVQDTPDALTKRFSKPEEFPLIFHHYMQNKAGSTARGLPRCRSEGIRQMERFCSHPVLHGASWAQVSFTWP